MNIIGDVKGRFCILIDDIVDSAGTLCNAAHGVLSGTAVERVSASALKELVITDTTAAASTKIRVLSIAPLIGEAIQRIAEESSVSSLFD
jgi:ribose-phosphate pyrophosphokinase